MKTRSIALAAVCVAAAAGAQPRFSVVGGVERHYGRVPLKQDIRDTLTITNSGTGVLKIIGINPTCGCTAAVIDTSDIPAGKSAHVFVHIDPPDAPGKIHKTIEFMTNDLAHLKPVVGFGFEIMRNLLATPRHFAFAGCQIHKPCEMAVSIHNRSDTAISLIRQPNTVPGLKSLMPDSVTLAPHDSLDYRLRWTPDTTGYMMGRFVLRTSSWLEPTYEFNVVANVADENGVPPMPKHR